LTSPVDSDAQNCETPAPAAKSTESGPCLNCGEPFPPLTDEWTGINGVARAKGFCHWFCWDKFDRVQKRSSDATANGTRYRHLALVFDSSGGHT
jgi:hypothetical protein